MKKFLIALLTIELKGIEPTPTVIQYLDCDKNSK